MFLHSAFRRDQAISVFHKGRAHTGTRPEQEMTGAPQARKSKIETRTEPRWATGVSAVKQAGLTKARGLLKPEVPHRSGRGAHHRPLGIVSL